MWHVASGEFLSYADKESLAGRPQLLVFGREYTDLAIWIYNLGNRWSHCTPMNLPRGLFATIFLADTKTTWVSSNSRRT